MYTLQDCIFSFDFIIAALVVDIEALLVAQLAPVVSDRERGPNDVGSMPAARRRSVKDSMKALSRLYGNGCLRPR